MKKIKKLFPLLLALMMLFTAAVPAQAKTEASDAEVKSGSTSAKVAFLIEDVLALEGTISTDEKTGFKVKSVEVANAQDGSIIQKSPEGDQVVIVGRNIPADIKLTVELESSSPMKNGEYPVTLNYGRTGSSGNYNADSKVVARIYVGVSKPSGKDDKDSGDSQSSSSTTQTTVEQTETIETAPLPEEVETEAPDRVGMLGLLDTYQLRSALEEAEKLKASGLLNRSQLETLQQAIDLGEQAMEEGVQADIDKAAMNLVEVIEELGGTVEERQEKETTKREGSGLSPAIILAVVAALVAIGAVAASYLLKKKKNTAYDGAPIVNYHIGDDDEV